MSDPAPAVTMQTLRNCHMRWTSKTELPRGGSIMEQVCIEHFRLGRETYKRTPEAAERITYTVDGQRCRDLDEALRFLNGPVIPADLFERMAS